MHIYVTGLAFFSTYHVIFSSNLANDSFNPTPASSLSFFLFTHSFTVYCIHVLFFYPHFFYRIPSSSFCCQFSSLKGNRTYCCIGLVIACRFNLCKKTRLCHSKAKKYLKNCQFPYVNPSEPKEENLEDSEKECSDFVFL